MPKKSLADFDNAAKKNDVKAAFLILKDDQVSLDVYNRCKDKLNMEEKIFLCRGTNPTDIAEIIRDISIHPKSL